MPSTLLVGIGQKMLVGSTIVDKYFKVSNVRQAHEVFNGIYEPDTGLWNTVICRLVGNSHFEELVVIFRDIVGKGTQLDSTTLTVVVPTAAELRT